MFKAPWTIVEANDRNFATLKIMITATQAIETHIERVTRTLGHQTIKYLDIPELNLPEISGSVLDKVDLTKTIFSEDYEESKKFYQQKLETLQYELFRKKHSMTIVL